MSERLFVRLSGDLAPGPETSAPPGSLVDTPVGGALAPYVASIMRYREDLGEREVIERVLPDGAVRIAFNFGAAPTTAGEGQQAEAIGASIEPALVRLRGRMDGITVTLRPGAAFALLGVPARELTQSAIPLDDLWRDALPLHEQLQEAPNDHACVTLLERAFCKRLNRRQMADDTVAMRAAQRLTRAAGDLTVRQLAASLGLSERRLQQLFAQHVGLSPRAWSRLARMHALLRALRERPARTWARLAAEAGFYDQAHLSNEFRALCGISPSAFFEQISGSSKTAG
jgi:AraC-like DNA-binding protein